MPLIGVNRSPCTRRAAITPEHCGIRCEQRDLSGFGNRAEVRAANSLGRIPALVLDGGETLIDSAAIVDHRRSATITRPRRCIGPGSTIAWHR